MVEKQKRVVVSLEKDIQREICEWLAKNGYLYWRQNNIPVFGMNNGGKMTFRAQSKHTPKGLPDIFVINHGKIIGIEVKRPGNTLSEDQKVFMKTMHMHGGHYYVANSLDDVVKTMAIFPRP